MKRYFKKTLLVAFVLTLAVPAALSAKSTKAKKQNPPVEQTWPLDGIPGFAVLRLENGGQDTLRVEARTSQASLPNIMANDVDFIDVVGSQTEVTLYEQPNFRGHSLTLRCGNYELLQQPRNDIESVRVRYVAAVARACQGTPERPVQYRTWTR